MTLKNKLIHAFALFGSFGTLLCCAMPALFVSLGAGAALIGLVSAVPQLVLLSEHKVGLFIFAGAMLTISGVSRYLTRNAPCPIDAKAARTCKRLRRLGFGVFCFSLLMYSVGFYFAFIAQHLMK